MLFIYSKLEVIFIGRNKEIQFFSGSNHTSLYRVRQQNKQKGKKCTETEEFSDELGRSDVFA